MTEPSPPPGTGSPPHDPRTIVTPYAFDVDDDLLGRMLATPKRRLAAILIDLTLASVLASLGGVLVGFAVAFIFFRIAVRHRVQHPLKRWARGTLALLGASVVFITVVAVTDDGWQIPFGADEPDTTAVGERNRAEDLASVRDSIAYALEREGVEPSDLRAAGIPSTLVDALTATPASHDTMGTDARTRAVATLRAYADALSARDSIRTDSLRAQVANVAAGRQLRELRTALERAEEQNDELEDRTEELAEDLQNPSLWRVVRSAANDVGLSLGWVGVYFTIFLSWWNGQTPGKRLLGLRVVRLDGNPITLWIAFERFGGYAAGFATGLLGFAQVYWDANRQGIHDRIANTVVLHSSTD